MIKKTTTTVYTTTDGEEFTDLKKAEAHEVHLKNIRMFWVSCKPDLTEGRGYRKEHLVYVNALYNHELFVIHKMSELYGNPVVFVQGVYGSNAIEYAWFIKDVTEKAEKEQLNLSEHEGIDVIYIEEKFVDKLWS